MEITMSTIINSIFYPIIFIIIIYYIFNWVNNFRKLRNIVKTEYKNFKNNNPYKNNNIYNKYNNIINNSKNKLTKEEFTALFNDPDNPEPNNVNKKINEMIDEYNKKIGHECNPQITLSNSKDCKQYLNNKYDMKKVGYYNEDENNDYEFFNEDNKSKSLKEKENEYKYFPKAHQVYEYGKKKWENTLKDPNSFESKLKYKWYNEIDKKLELPDNFSISTTNDEIIDSRVRTPMDIMTDYYPELYNCNRPYYECYDRIKVDKNIKNNYDTKNEHIIDKKSLINKINYEDKYTETGEKLELIKKIKDFENNKTLSPYNLDNNNLYSFDTN